MNQHETGILRREVTVSLEGAEQGIFNPGDIITFSVPDKRLWKRILHFVTFREPPLITEEMSVISIDGEIMKLDAEAGEVLTCVYCKKEISKLHGFVDSGGFKFHQSCFMVVKLVNSRKGKKKWGKNVI